MKLQPCLAAALALAAAACNESRSGANERVRFTPDECGNVNCTFDDSIGVGGTISITIDGIDGFPTAGLDLASRDPDLFSVAPRSDIAGRPAWDLTAHAAGVGELVALDGSEEIDFIEIPIQEVIALTMDPFAGDIVGPNEEAGYDEAFTVNANEAVSWFVRPVVEGDAITMGRYSFETVLDAGAPSVVDHEAANSDRPNGYLYVTLPAGDYPVRFELTDDPDVFVEAIIHAQ